LCLKQRVACTAVIAGTGGVQGAGQELTEGRSPVVVLVAPLHFTELQPYAGPLSAAREREAPAANRYRAPLVQADGAAVGMPLTSATTGLTRQLPQLSVGWSKTQLDTLKAQITVYKALLQGHTPSADDIAKVGSVLAAASLVCAAPKCIFGIVRMWGKLSGSAAPKITNIRRW
jgi:hypothetical protein